MNSSIFQPLDVDLHQKLKTDYEWFQEKLAYMERRSLSGIMSSGSASSHGPRLEDDLEMAIADEWMEQFMAAENSDESEHDAENSDESEHDEVVKEEVEKDEYEHDAENSDESEHDEVVKEEVEKDESHGNQDKFRITLDLEQCLGRWFDEEVVKEEVEKDEYHAYIMKRLEMSSDDYDAYNAEFSV